MTNPNPRWLGIVMTPPSIGAPLVIGRPGERAFMRTTPVTRLFSRDDGILVQTEGSRYFIGIAGNTYHLFCVSAEEVWEPTDLELALRPQAPLPAPLPRSRAPRASTIRARRSERGDEDVIAPDDVTALRSKQTRDTD